MRSKILMLFLVVTFVFKESKWNQPVESNGLPNTQSPYPWWKNDLYPLSEGPLQKLDSDWLKDSQYQPRGQFWNLHQGKTRNAGVIVAIGLDMFEYVFKSAWNILLPSNRANIRMVSHGKFLWQEASKEVLFKIQNKCLPSPTNLDLIM